MPAKRIAFLAYFGHQRRFFDFLAAHLPNTVRADIFGVYPVSASARFLTRFAAALASPAAGLSDIVAFSRRKYLIRHPGLSAACVAILDRFQAAKAAAYYGWFRHALTRGRYDLLVVWNGLPLPVAAAARAARDLGIRTLFCENGVLPKTVTMDPKGVNAGGALMDKPAEFYHGVVPNAQALRDLFETPLVARPLNTRVTNVLPGEEHLVLPEEYVFLPLQVHDDSQILMYSPRFSDMASVVRFCAEGIAAYNAANGTRLALVVKEHPSDYGRIDYAPLRAAYPQVQFTRLHSTADLIARAKAVVTVNSSVGIEALLSLKPVLSLGQAFYNVPGVVYPVKNDETLDWALNTALSKPVDRDLIEKFLYFLRYEYLVGLDRRALDAADAEPAVRRIMDVLGEGEGSACTWF